MRAQGGLLFVPVFIAAACLISLLTLSYLVRAKRALLLRDPSASAQARRSLPPQRPPAPGVRLSIAARFGRTRQVSSYTGIVEAALGAGAGRFAEVMNFACCFGICRRAAPRRGHAGEPQLRPPVAAAADGAFSLYRLVACSARGAAAAARTSCSWARRWRPCSPPRAARTRSCGPSRRPWFSSAGSAPCPGAHTTDPPNGPPAYASIHARSVGSTPDPARERGRAAAGGGGRSAALIASVGNISVGLGIAFVCWNALKQGLSLAALPLANPAGFGSYFGSVAFLFFIHFTLPAIESSMADPDRFMPATAKARPPPPPHARAAAACARRRTCTHAWGHVHARC